MARTKFMRGPKGATKQDVSRILKKMKKFEQTIESNFKDNSVTTAITQTALRQNLTNIAQGDNVGNRNGLKVTAKNLLIRGKLVGDGTNVVRTIVVQDKRNDGASFGTLDLLEENSVYSPLNMNDQQGRFRVLWDKTFVLDQLKNDIVVYKKFIKLDNIVHFSGTADTNTGPGSIWVFQLSDSVLGINQEYKARFKYSDA